MEGENSFLIYSKMVDGLFISMTHTLTLMISGEL